jgi:hypothetical protein
MGHVARLDEHILFRNTGVLCIGTIEVGGNETVHRIAFLQSLYAFANRIYLAGHIQSQYPDLGF